MVSIFLVYSWDKLAKTFGLLESLVAMPAQHWGCWPESLGKIAVCEAAKLARCKFTASCNYSLEENPRLCRKFFQGNLCRSNNLWASKLV